MFGLVLQRDYDSVALDLECERVHFKNEIQSAKDRLEMTRMENTCLKIANRDLVKRLDGCEKELDMMKHEAMDLKLKLQSLEARWGNGACI